MRQEAAAANRRNDCRAVNVIISQARSSNAAKRTANRFGLNDITAESLCHLCVAGEQLILMALYVA